MNMETNLGVLEENFRQSELDALGFEKCMCNEVGEKLRKSESKCSELESEIQKIKRDNQILDGKLTALKEEKSAIEDELKVLKMENPSKPSYGGEEEDENFQLRIEIKTLECEKQVAEKEVEIWKQKYELESRVSKLNQDQVFGKKEQEEAATPYNDTPDKHFCNIKEDKSGENHLHEERNRAKRVTRKVLFREDVEPIENMALSDARLAPLSIIDESNLVDIEMHHSLNDRGEINCSFSNECVMEGTMVGNKKATKIGNLGDVEEVDDCEENVEVVSILKRKKACNVVTSDSESDVEDNIPISQLFGICPLEATPNQAFPKSKGCSPVSSRDGIDNISDTVMCTRRRLVKLRQNEVSGGKKKSRKMMSEDIQDDDSAEGSDDERDSLDDFIVTDSDDDSHNELEDDVDCDDENVVDAERDYQDDSDSEDGSPDYTEWEYEADMLASLGKDPVLCMKGVCAIYRRQIPKEPDHGIPFYPDGRGFSLFDAPRGSKLAYFLTEGDPDSDVKKSVEELIEFDPAGEDICYKLAARYSRQLFEIYKNKEDPYFPLS